MSLDRDDEYAFRKREVEALEAIGKAATIIVQEHEERQNARKQFDDGIREAGGNTPNAPAGDTPATTSTSSAPATTAQSDPPAK